MIHAGVFQAQRTPDEVFDLLSSPERFAPLLPDYESIAMQDATHFTLRTVIAIGEIKGHANLAMELAQASRATRVEYRGAATIAGSQLTLAIHFQIAPQAEITEVSWQGEVKLEGTLAMMAGKLLETAGRQNFDRMGERLQSALQAESPASATQPATGEALAETDFDI
jgi:carbon monoxide dehydrogenase subunit G